MNISEFRQLKKILMLAAHNDSDAEALAGFRKATAMLTKAGVTWEQALDRVLKVVNEVEPGPSHHEDDDPDALFERALDNARGDFRDTLLSIQSQYEMKGWLSQRQWEVVRRAAER